MQGMLVSEVSFGRPMRVPGALLLLLLWMKVGVCGGGGGGAVGRRELVAATGDG